MEHGGKRGAPKWSEPSFLDNVFPTGRFIYRGEAVDGAHEPIVPRELWEAYQARRWARARRPRAEKAGYLLSGSCAAGHAGTCSPGRKERAELLYRAANGREREAIAQALASIALTVLRTPESTPPGRFVGIIRSMLVHDLDGVGS